MKQDTMVKVYVDENEWYTTFPNLLTDNNSDYYHRSAVDIPKKEWQTYARALKRFNQLRKALVHKVEEAQRQEKG